MSDEVAILEQEETALGYRNADSYDHMIKVATGLAKSNIIPKDYQNNIANCMIALEMSQRLGVSPFGVMQSMYIVYGKPGWSSTFIIGKINKSAKIKGSLQFKKEGKIGSDDRSYTAFAYDQEGNLLEGTPVSVKMAKEEGWASKPGSKWKTMPEQMLAYRAATFFVRLYAPELLLGIQTQDEIIDVEGGVMPEEDINEAFNIEVPEQNMRINDEAPDTKLEEKFVDEAPKPIAEELVDEAPKPIAEEFIEDEQGRLIDPKTGKPI